METESSFESILKQKIIDTNEERDLKKLTFIKDNLNSSQIFNLHQTLHLVNMYNNTLNDTYKNLALKYALSTIKLGIQ